MNEYLFSEELPSVSQVAQKKHDPFRVLVSTVISLRTKDQVTLAASNKLFARADSPETLINVSENEIAGLIYPAGFYRTKARNLKRIAEILLEKFKGKVPEKMENLLALPGVGRKTANLVRNLGFGLDGICVDTHVHRVSNRTGWVKTKSPAETEMELMKILPRKYWIPINETLVRFGQHVCTPVSPRCSICPIPEYCGREGITR
ncbi:MAG: endonuclease III, partial [Spirochaetes bacterium]|nr:endonuclease III [Spirochaetota bacterium]